MTTISAPSITVAAVGTNLVSRIQSRLFAQVNILPLVYLRVVFGAITLWEVWRYFDKGWIARYYIDPTFHFTYYGFDWVRPWGGDGMYIHFALLGLLAFCIAVGAFYRISATLFFFAFTYIFLLDQTRYLNHFYLICLLSFLLIFIPANRAWSLDASVRKRLRSDAAPAWTLYLFRAQIGAVYVFGGIAKLNGNWLRGQPMQMWLAERTDFPMIGRWFDEAWMGYAFSYGGLLVDLLAVPLLFWKRSRPFALLALVAFHLTNARLFSIGIFPWLMLALLPVFLPSGWFLQLPKVNEDAAHSSSGLLRQRMTITLLTIYVVVQILVPLRHWLYPGNVSWTEEGHDFSWHMKLRSKSGIARFFVTDLQTNRRWEITLSDYLTTQQIDEMTGNPDMLLLFAHYLRDIVTQSGFDEVAVHVWVAVSLNGRPHALLIDPSVDLAAVERNPLRTASWIMQPGESGYVTWETD